MSTAIAAALVEELGNVVAYPPTPGAVEAADQVMDGFRNHPSGTRIIASESYRVIIGLLMGSSKHRLLIRQDLPTELLQKFDIFHNDLVAELQSRSHARVASKQTQLINAVLAQ